ncbi:MerR family transcriptional regulator [Roseateles microcysteis]|uniref:MerR family transcriptional regulator n=1 Tax=Roseateles microcysteis TaxID=3119057 RepID=UPI002FE6AA6A
MSPPYRQKKSQEFRSKFLADKANETWGPFAELAAREMIARSERMSAVELCKRCKIEHCRFRYLKQEGLVSPAKGKGRGAYYTEEHVAQVERAEQLAPQVGGLAKIRRLAIESKAQREAQIPTPGECGYRIERVYQLSTGIRIVVPEVIGEIATAQLSRLLLAADDSKVEKSDHRFEAVLSLLEEGDRSRTRPKTKAKGKPPNPLPSV